MKHNGTEYYYLRAGMPNYFLAAGQGFTALGVYLETNMPSL
ncbi:hypothetical protein DHBDCA_p147 [Dehalobacter sp. DCA]|nr:hypothetical protein DHBDCA_p147 [Dehalobacter sp. DCA]